MRILTNNLAAAVLAAIGLLSLALIAGSAAALGQAHQVLSKPVAGVLEGFAGVILAPFGLIMLLVESIPSVPQPVYVASGVFGIALTISVWAAVMAVVRRLVLRRR
jgi:hypothetical protein